MNSLLLAPHNDDEALFASYIIMRYKPLVVVCTYGEKQAARGMAITAEQRIAETKAACEILGVPCLFIPASDAWDDDLIAEEMGRQLASSIFDNVDIVFAPDKQGGNAQHDLVSSLAEEFFTDSLIRYYATYAKDQWFTPVGDTDIWPRSKGEEELKRLALDCYKSQHFQPHFKAVEGQAEFLR